MGANANAIVKTLRQLCASARHNQAVSDGLQRYRAISRSGALGRSDGSTKLYSAL